MSLELVGDYVWGGWILHLPRWELQLQGLFPNPRAGAVPLMLAPCSPPQENGGEPRSNSVSESPSSPGPLAMSRSPSETHSEVRLRILGEVVAGKRGPG